MSELEQLKNELKKEREARLKLEKQLREASSKISDLLSAPRPSKTPFVPIKLYSGGLPPYNEEQQKEFMEEEGKRPVEDITVSRDKFFNPKTDSFDKLTLQKHQEKFITKFINSDARGAILFHGTGTGKTLSAVATAYAYLRFNPSSRVFVITPSATLQNFIFGMVQWGLDVRDNRYNFFTYDRYFRNRPKCDDALLIIDEAHNFRTEIKAGTRRKKVGVDEVGEPVYDKVDVVKNAKGLAILENCSSVAKKVLLLTATPFVNTIYDIENLMAMAFGTTPVNTTTFAEISSSSKARDDYFRCSISRFSLPTVSDDFPEKREALIPIYMDEEFSRAYSEIENSPSRAVKAYFNGVRRISNSFGGVNNKKVNFVIDIIQRGGRTVVYSTFLETGIQLLKDRLDALNIRYAEITGRQNAVGKEISKNRFNGFIPDSESYAKKVKKIAGIDLSDPEEAKTYNVDVLLITKASAEGVDLIGTENMVLMDGAWNESTIQQIVARAVRFRSHAHLPKNKRFVNIYRMLLVKPSDKALIDRIGASQLPQWGALFEKVLEKEKLRKELMKDGAKRRRIVEKSKRLKENTIARKLAKEKKLSIADVKAMPKEKRAEAWKKVEFDKLDVFKKEAQLLANEDGGSLSRPSIDLYMLIRSKAKQLVINNFVDALSDVETIEQCQSPKESEYFKRVNTKQQELGRDLTPAEKDDIRREIFSSDLKDFSLKIQEEVKESVNDLSKILEKSAEKAKRKLDRAIVNNLQELFTPPTVVDEMLRRVGILDDKRDGLRVLEPTAGEGALILPLVKKMAKGNQFYNIDLVEYSPENRKVLEDFGHSNYIELMEEPNFMLYVPQQKYDYIIMNPPFHLKRTNFRDLYRRDVYDVDFVKRAFGMLKEGGKLIAITSQSFMANKSEPFVSFRKWLKTKNAIVQKTTQGWAGTFSQNKKKQELMSKLSLKNFAFIRLVKESKDIPEDESLVNIDYDIIKNRPEMVGDQPAKFLKDSSNQEPIKVLEEDL